METALIVIFIILAIESIALTFLYVKFSSQKKNTQEIIDSLKNLIGK